MIFYLTHGKVLHATQAEAKALDREFVQLDIPTDKRSLMAFVQNLYDRAQQSEVLTQLKHDEDRREVPAPLVPVVPQIVDVDDLWDHLPLARKAHFAALFCEEARIKIK